MNKLQLLNTSGEIRKISELNTIQTDDGKELDVNKIYNIKVYVPHVDKERPVSKSQNLMQAQDELIKKLTGDFKFDFRYKNAIFDGKIKDENKESYKKVVEFSENPKNGETFKSVMLYGVKSWGCGKTYLTNALANKWFMNPKTSIIINQFKEVKIEYTGVSYQLIRGEDLMLRVLATYKKEPEEFEIDIYNSLSKYDILAIDDIGKFIPTNLEFYRRVLFQIVDTRYNQGKGLIISANFGKESILKYLGIAIVDRLREMTMEYELEFKGEGYRAKKS